jgi:hypothetical protein
MDEKRPEEVFSQNTKRLRELREQILAQNPAIMGIKAKTMNDWIDEKTTKQDEVMAEKYENGASTQKVFELDCTLQGLKDFDQQFKDQYGDEAYEKMFDTAEIDKRLQEGRAKWENMDEFVTLEEKDVLAAANGEDPLAEMKKLAGLKPAVEQDRSSFEILKEKLSDLEETLLNASRLIADVKAELKLLKRLSVRK